MLMRNGEWVPAQWNQQLNIKCACRNKGHTYGLGGKGTHNTHSSVMMYSFVAICSPKNSKREDCYMTLIALCRYHV